MKQLKKGVYKALINHLSLLKDEKIIDLIHEKSNDVGLSIEEEKKLNSYISSINPNNNPIYWTGTDKLLIITGEIVKFDSSDNDWFVIPAHDCKENEFIFTVNF
jgi:hypothetical protein